MEIIKILILVNIESTRLGNLIYHVLSKNEIAVTEYEEMKFPKYEFSLLNISKVTNDSLEDRHIIIVFDNVTLFHVNALTNGSVPIIYFYDERYNVGIPMNVASLQNIILIQDNVDVNKFFGVPIEIIIYARLNLYRLNHKLKLQTKKRVENIAYFISHKDDELLTAKKVIRLFNYLSEYQLNIFTNSLNQFLLEEICNDNIQFLNDESFKNEQFLNYDLIIGSDLIAAIALRASIPVFVLGTHGIGGLVNSENIKDFYRTGFKGRIGGVFGEEVPLKLLEIVFEETLTEIYLKAEQQIDVVDRSEIAHFFDFSNNESLIKIYKILHETFSKNAALQNEKKFNSLSIKNFSRVIDIKPSEESGDSLVIVNSETGKLLGTLGPEEARIYKKCKIGISISELYAQFPDYEFEDINSFIKELLENKILTITQQTDYS